MAVFGGGRIHADPKTPSQLRAALAASQSQTDTLQTEIDTVEADLDAIESQAGPVSAIFDSTASLGQAVRVASAGHVDLANAGAAATAGIVGLVFTAATAGNTGAYITSGQITVVDWTAVIGAASLTAGSLYYLNTTNGQLTTTAPTTVGQVVVQVGRALTTTTLSVSIHLGVLL